MKKIVLILFVLFICTDVAISSIPPSPYSTTEKSGDINAGVLTETGSTQTVRVQEDPGYNREEAREHSRQLSTIEEKQRWELKERNGFLLIMFCLCIAAVIALILIWRLIVWVFKILNRALDMVLDKINRACNRIKTKSDNIGRRINNGISRSKRRVSQTLSPDNNTGGSGNDMKHLGFDFVKKSWVKAGVNRTLEQTGLDIKYTRHITNSLDSIGRDIWNLVLDCTKGLNNQCSNVFSSLIALELYKLIFIKNIEATNSMPLINDSVRQLQDSIEYQSKMGNELSIAEAKNRFEFIQKRFQ